MTLTDEEKSFLRTVYRRQDTDDPVQPILANPIKEPYRRLVDLGYMRVVRLVCAVFRQPTGEVCFKLTEAGTIALGLDAPPPAAPTERPGIDI